MPSCDNRHTITITIIITLTGEDVRLGPSRAGPYLQHAIPFVVRIPRQTQYLDPILQFLQFGLDIFHFHTRHLPHLDVVPGILE